MAERSCETLRFALPQLTTTRCQPASGPVVMTGSAEIPKVSPGQTALLPYTLPDTRMTGDSQPFLIENSRK